MIEKRSKNWFLQVKYVTEATTPLFLDLCKKLAHDADIFYLSHSTSLVPLCYSYQAITI